jgi:hypothetical protein
MEKILQKEILEKRNSLFLQKELKNIDPKRTFRPSKTECEYLSILSDNELEEELFSYNGKNNVDNSINPNIIENKNKLCLEIKNLNNNSKIKESKFSSISIEPSETKRKSNVSQSLSVHQDFPIEIIEGNEKNKDNYIKPRHLVYACGFLVVTFAGITALNDYIMLSYFTN